MKMKTLHLSMISLGSILLWALFGNGAYAQCIHDTDWPEKPCLDTPPYSGSEVKKLWEPYYTMKGKEWMKMKKAEMYQADKDRILDKWTEYGGKINFANYNVWFYYHLYGQAPDLAPYYTGNITKNNFELIITYYYISPIAVGIIGIITGSVGVTGFFLVRKTLSKNGIKK